MAPNAENSSSCEVSAELKQKFCSILVKHGMRDRVESVTMREPEELRGEHMATATLYVTINFKNQGKPKNLFMKKFAGGQWSDSVKDAKLMDKESEFYNSFLPMCRGYCKNKGCENLLNFFPTCLYSDHTMIVLENHVLDHQYVMLPKENLQDLETAKIVLENLAKFHAATYSLVDDSGKDAFLKRWELVCTEVFYSGKIDFCKTMFDNGIKNCISILKGAKIGGYEEAIEKLSSLTNTYEDTKKCVLFEAKDKLLVVNHGDLWNNNLLFKLSRGKDGKRRVTDNMFVDLQVTRLASPSLDIMYFLYTSVKPNVRREHLKELLSHYFDVFSSTLKLFDKRCPVTFDAFVNDFNKRLYFGYLTNLNFMSLSAALKDFDPEDLGTTEDEIAAAFAKIMGNWISKNTEKVTNISQEILAVIKEYEELSAPSPKD